MADLSNTKLVDLLPASISGDANVIAAASAIDGELQKVTALIPEAVLIARIDVLPEKVLDLLAWQWHVDFYEPVGFSIEKKRAVIKNSIAWHRKKGTPWAVAQVVGAVFAQAEIKEWFDYGGDPYKFKIRTIDMLKDEQAYQLLRRAIGTAKNTRSWLESIEIHREITQPLFAGAITGDGGTRTVLIARPDIETTEDRFFGSGGYLSGFARVLPSMPRQSQVSMPLGLTAAKGGYQKILYDPADLPVHDKISAAMGWPMAILLQKCAAVAVRTSNPKQATGGFHVGGFEASHGSIQVRASPPKDGRQSTYAGAILAHGGIYTIQVRR